MGRGSWTLDPKQYIIFVSDAGEENVEVNVKDLIKRLEASLALADPEVRDHCVARLKCVGDENATAYFEFHTPWTKAQKKAWEEREKQLERERAAREEKHERELLAELKAKYERDPEQN